MGPSVTVYDISSPAAVAELFVYLTDAASFLKFPARYVLALTGTLLTQRAEQSPDYRKIGEVLDRMAVEETRQISCLPWTR